MCDVSSVFRYKDISRPVWGFFHVRILQTAFAHCISIAIAFENLTSIVIGAMVLLIGFGIGYCIYSHRYQEIIIFLVVGMIMMAGMFAVTVVEDICDTLAEKISDL